MVAQAVNPGTEMLRQEEEELETISGYTESVLTCKMSKERFETHEDERWRLEPLCYFRKLRTTGSHL